MSQIRWKIVLAELINELESISVIVIASYNWVATNVGVIDISESLSARCTCPLFLRPRHKLLTFSRLISCRDSPAIWRKGKFASIISCDCNKSSWEELESKMSCVQDHPGLLRQFRRMTSSMLIKCERLFNICPRHKSNFSIRTPSSLISDSQHVESSGFWCLSREAVSLAARPIYSTAVSRREKLIPSDRLFIGEVSCLLQPFIFLLPRNESY